MNLLSVVDSLIEATSSCRIHWKCSENGNGHVEYVSQVQEDAVFIHETGTDDGAAYSLKIHLHNKPYASSYCLPFDKGRDLFWAVSKNSSQKNTDLGVLFAKLQKLNRP